MDEKDVNVTLNNGVLTLKGEKKSEREERKDDYHLMERSYGSFQRSFQVADTSMPTKSKQLSKRAFSRSRYRNDRRL